MKWMDTLRGLVNSISGIGGERDKAAAGNWHYTPLERVQVENAYRSNWMCRKAVDIPAFDMLREGWAWQADEAVVAKIEAEEKRLQVNKRVLEAKRQARLFGGAAILISDGRGEYEEPLEPDSIAAGGVSFLKVLDRYHLTSGTIDTDPLSPTYLEPLWYDVSGTAQGTTRIHPSRVIRFIGAELPTDWDTLTDRWGDSILDAIEIAIRDATAGQQGIAALIQEAKVDVFKVEGFMQNIKSEVYKQAVEDRFSLVNRLKSTVNAIVLDKEDEYEQKQISFQQLPDVQRLQLQIVSGACDIPATRFLGQAPQGMNATGEGDERNYYQRIGAEQELSLRPPLERLFAFTVRSALGQYPQGLWFRFRPLWQLSEKERAEIFKAKADAARILVGKGQEQAIFPIEAVSDAMVAALTEDGSLPGLDKAMIAYGGLQGSEPSEKEEEDATMPPDRKAAGDAKPRTLYVHRKVLNGDEILAWAREQGFTSTLPASDLHVTIAFSRAKVDWMRMGSTWEDEVTIPPGGPRLVERFDGGAVVLLFASNMLSWRHDEMVDRGASWDWPEYQPHITISYNGAPADLDGIEAYQGRIVLGPEVFEEINEDWKAGITEL